jgi:hypothetical protein
MQIERSSTLIDRNKTDAEPLYNPSPIRFLIASLYLSRMAVASGEEAPVAGAPLVTAMHPTAAPPTSIFFFPLPQHSQRRCR